MMVPGFLVDVGVGIPVERALRRAGYDVRAVREINASMRDADILALGVAEKRVVVTMDRDFGELIFKEGEEHHGVLLLRVEDATAEEKARVVLSIVASHADELPRGVAVYQRGRLRIRPVPLG